MAADAGLVGEVRAVVVYLPCRTCGGTGKYHGWYDREWSEPCRRCQGGGNVRLDFVETTLCLPGAPDRVWHTPDQLCPIALLNLMPTRQLEGCGQYRGAQWFFGAGSGFGVAAVVCDFMLLPP